MRGDKLAEQDIRFVVAAIWEMVNFSVTLLKDMSRVWGYLKKSPAAAMNWMGNGKRVWVHFKKAPAELTLAVGNGQPFSNFAQRHEEGLGLF